LWKGRAGEAARPEHTRSGAVIEEDDTFDAAGMSPVHAMGARPGENRYYYLARHGSD